MKLIEQFSYRSPYSFRPQAKILTEESLNMWGVFFTWGELDLSEKVFENTRAFIEAYLNQSEITNPFGYNQSLTGVENALKTGCLIANDVIYRLTNQVTLSSGVEGFITVRKGRELACIQVGQPHAFLKRHGTLLPLVQATDILAPDSHSKAFLPHRLIGIHPDCYPNLQSVHIEKGDTLVLLAHSVIPSSLFKVSHNNSASHHDTPDSRDALKQTFQGIIREYPDYPFWISELQIF